MKKASITEAEPVRRSPEMFVDHAHMPHIVWLTGTKLTSYAQLERAFQAFKRRSRANQKLQQEDVFAVWSKSEGFWKSDGTILISIQATLAFTDFLVRNYAVGTTSKDSTIGEVED